MSDDLIVTLQVRRTPRGRALATRTVRVLPALPTYTSDRDLPFIAAVVQEEAAMLGSAANAAVCEVRRRGDAR